MKTGGLWDEDWRALVNSAELRQALEFWGECSRLLVVLGGQASDEASALVASYQYRVGLRAFDGAGRRRDGRDMDHQILAFNARLGEISEECRGQVQVLNDYRLMLGLQPLAINVRLYKAAQGHSEWMAESGRFSHESSLPGLTTPRQRAQAAGYPSPFIGENIGRGQGDGQGAHRSWYNSSGHHRNMLGKRYFEVGVGHRNRLWTQLLGGGRSNLR